MKQLFFAFITAILFTSCAAIGNRYTYTYEIISADTTSPGLSYTDDIIDINFSITRRIINFNLVNKSTSPLKIIWDETVIIKNNTPLSIINNSVAFEDKHLAQIPSILPPGTSMKNSLLPKKNIYWDSNVQENGYDKGKWKVENFFPTNDLGSKKRSMAIYSLEGQTVSIYMPIIVGEEKKEYTFTFKIADISKKNYN